MRDYDHLVLISRVTFNTLTIFSIHLISHSENAYVVLLRFPNRVTEYAPTLEPPSQCAYPTS